MAGGNMNAFLCYLAVILAGTARGIVIVGQENIVHVVENGTTDPLVLDCPYLLEEEDDLGLHVKWFHVNNPVQVYQWIYGAAPQSVGVLEDRVDLAYEASPDPQHMYRALHILEPTTELSGEYTCRVASYLDEKVYRQKLIVYSRPVEVRVWTEKRSDEEVTVLCEADDVYPEPQLNLVIVNHNNGNSTALPNIRKQNEWSRGSYSAQAEADINELDLGGPVEFECQVVIPDTNLNFPNTTYYEPSVEEIESIEVTVIEEIESEPVLSGGCGGSAVISVVLGLAMLLLYV